MVSGRPEKAILPLEAGGCRRRRRRRRKQEAKASERKRNEFEMPILRIDVLRKLFIQSVGQARAPGRRETLRILRIDVLRELFVQSVR